MFNDKKRTLSFQRAVVNFDEIVKISQAENVSKFMSDLCNEGSKERCYIKNFQKKRINCVDFNLAAEINRFQAHEM